MWEQFLPQGHQTAKSELNNKLYFSQTFVHFHSELDLTLFTFPNTQHIHIKLFHHKQRKYIYVYCAFSNPVVAIVILITFI